MLLKQLVCSHSQASTAPCNKLVCVTGNDVSVSLPTGFGKSCRGLRAFESSRLAPQALQVYTVHPSKKQKVYVSIYTSDYYSA